MLKRYNYIKDRVHLFLFEIENHVSIILKTLTMLASAVCLIVFVLYYGFDNSAEQNRSYLTIIKWSFFIYLANYLARLYYARFFKSFIKEFWIESILMFVFVLDNMYYFKSGIQLVNEISIFFGIQNYEAFYNLVLQGYILVFVWIDVVAYNEIMLNFQIKPALLFILSFFSIMLLGTFTLMLPEMTHSGNSLSFVDALFTAVSATCVTGLIVVDTADFFTYKGQFVIMALIQIGGIGIVSFASFFALFIKSGVGIKHQTILQDFLSTESLYNTRSLLRRIIFYTVIIEFIGAIFLFFLWSPNLEFQNIGHKIFYSIFHSISAFNNAGFSLFTLGFMDQAVNHAYIFQIVIAMLIIFGGIGFSTLRDLFDPTRLRERMAKPWMQWKTSTTVSIHASILLIFGGLMLFYFLEKENVLQGLSLGEAMVTSFFQSVTTRTAGFNTVDINILNTPTLILFIFLMYIGASSGGTGGGIKTSTFFILFLSALSTIKGRKKLVFKRRTISFDLVNKAYTIFIFSATYILVLIFLMTIFEPQFSIMQIVFEVVSAFGTVGLSMGVTSTLSDVGKFLIVLTMFIGRVGTLTLAFALSSPVNTRGFKYPNTHMMVG